MRRFLRLFSVCEGAQPLKQALGPMLYMRGKSQFNARKLHAKSYAAVGSRGMTLSCVILSATTAFTVLVVEVACFEGSILPPGTL